jgi:hypothetical protein
MTRTWRRGFTLVLGCLGSVSLGCGGGCPAPNAAPQQRAQWHAELERKTELKLDATRSLTIKRDVHVFEVDADADAVATAFHQVVRDPERRFGLIQVDRPDAERGQPFHEGSRFQGRYRIEDTSKLLEHLNQYPPVRQGLCELENGSTSDFGVIRILQLPPEPKDPSAPAHPAVGTTYVLEYHYLEGSPIAGSSRFEVQQLADGKSSLQQIFTYQELTLPFAAFFSNGGLTLHDQVVYGQVAQAAASLGVTYRALDLPPQYGPPTVGPH